MNGKILKQTFGAKEPLSAVRLYTQLQSGEPIESFTLMTNFPKRVFNDEDMETPLAELGKSLKFGIMTWSSIRNLPRGGRRV